MNKSIFLLKTFKKYAFLQIILDIFCVFLLVKIFFMIFSKNHFSENIPLKTYFCIIGYTLLRSIYLLIILVSIFLQKEYKQLFRLSLFIALNAILYTEIFWIIAMFGAATAGDAS